MNTNLIKTYIASLLVALTAAILLSIALASIGHARQHDADRAGTFSFGGAVGLQAGTAGNTALALGLYGDYYINHRFSVGPLLQMGLTMISSKSALLDRQNIPSTLPDFQSSNHMSRLVLDSSMQT